VDLPKTGMTGACPAEMACCRPESNTADGAEQCVSVARRIATGPASAGSAWEVVRGVPRIVQAARR
jgi:hypothetical protein